MNKNILEKSLTLEELYTELGFSETQLAKVEEYFNLFKMMKELREAKKESNFSQDKLSEISGIPRPEISKILNGKTNVSLSRLSALASALGKKLEIRIIDDKNLLAVNEPKSKYKPD